jgi:hypothetical protein
MTNLAWHSDHKPEPVTNMGLVVNLSEGTVTGFAFPASIYKTDATRVEFKGENGSWSVWGSIDRITSDVKATTTVLYPISIHLMPAGYSPASADAARSGEAVVPPPLPQPHRLCRPDRCGAAGVRGGSCRAPGRRIRSIGRADRSLCAAARSRTSSASRRADATARSDRSRRRSRDCRPTGW